MRRWEEEEGNKEDEGKKDRQKVRNKERKNKKKTKEKSCSEQHEAEEWDCLDLADVVVAHAAAAVDEEEQLPGGPLQLRRLRQQVWAEVQHQDRAAQNVLMVTLPHKLQLQGNKTKQTFR